MGSHAGSRFAANWLPYSAVDSISASSRSRPVVSSQPTSLRATTRATAVVAGVWRVPARLRDLAHVLPLLIQCNHALRAELHALAFLAGGTYGNLLAGGCRLLGLLLLRHFGAASFRRETTLEAPGRKSNSFLPQGHHPSPKALEKGVLVRRGNTLM